MIKTHEAFETALEEATGLLARPPAEGTRGYQNLLNVMRDIAAYRPAVIVEKRQATSEAQRLSQRLDVFEHSLPPHFKSHWHSMVGGDLSGREN